MRNKSLTEIMIRIARCVAAYIVFMLALSLFDYCFITERNGEELITKAIKSNVINVAAALIFSTVYLTFARYDSLAYDEFTSNRGKKFKLFDDAVRVGGTFDFLLDCIFLVVSSFLLPSPAMFPLLIALDFTVRMLARKEWYGGKPYERSAVLPLIRDLVLWTLAFAFIAYISPSYVGIFGIVGWLALEHVYVTLAVIFVPAIIYFLVSYTVAFLKRISFIKALKRTCKTNGYKLSKIKRPYFSILDVTDNEDFTVEANGRTYVCKLLSGKRRSIPMIFSDDGTAAYEHGLGFGKAKVVNYYKSFSYELPNNGIKCVIVTHHPRKFFTETQGSTRQLHLGDRFGGYNLLHPDAFLRSVENNTLI